MVETHPVVAAEVRLLRHRQLLAETNGQGQRQSTVEHKVFSGEEELAVGVD